MQSLYVWLVRIRPSDSPLSTGDTLTESAIRRTLSSHRLIEISGNAKQKAGESIAMTYG